MVIRVSPGAKPPHERHGHEKSAKRFGTQLTETIRASGATPRKQAGHRSVPDRGEPKTRKRPCNAGAIHTGRWANHHLLFVVLVWCNIRGVFDPRISNSASTLCSSYRRIFGLVFCYRRGCQIGSEHVRSAHCAGLFFL